MLLIKTDIHFFTCSKIYQTSKSQGYRRVVILCATIEPDDVDLGICADGPLAPLAIGDATDLPWAAKAGKKKTGWLNGLNQWEPV